MMKCQCCGNGEATFHYQSTVNGHRQEAHLCRRCAQAQGYGQGWSNLMPHRGGWSDPLFTGMMNRMFTEFPAPGNTVAEAEAAAAQREEQLLTEEERRAFDLQRQRNALQYQLRQAVDTENYEEAARLRDALRSLPQ